MELVELLHSGEAQLLKGGDLVFVAGILSLQGCPLLALLGRWNGVGVAGFDINVGVRNLLDRLQRVQVLLVLNHQVVDGAGKGVLVHLTRLGVVVDLFLPFVEQSLSLSHRCSDLSIQSISHWQGIPVSIIII